MSETQHTPMRYERECTLYPHAISRAGIHQHVISVPHPNGRWDAVYCYTQQQAAFICRACNAHDTLVESLKDVDLRCAQARMVSNIGRQTLKTADFLRAELKRIATVARAALALVEKGE